MIIKRLNDNDPIYISRLMNAYALLSKEGKRRIRIIFEMIFRDEDSWQEAKEPVKDGEGVPHTQGVGSSTGDSKAYEG